MYIDSGTSLFIKTISILILTFLITLLCISLIYEYTKWSYWLKYSFLLSLLTCLWGYTFTLFSLLGSKDEFTNPFLFSIIIVPIDVILLYPGLKALGQNSDSEIGTFIFFALIIHGIAYYFLKKSILKYSDEVR